MKLAHLMLPKMALQKSTLLRVLLFSATLLGLTGCESEQAKARVATAADNVEVLSQVFEMPGLDRTRKVRIYLPPNYHSSEQLFAVLYMHDGQNLFDDKTSYVGEWGVDETLNRLYSEKNFSLIVVGVDNGQEKRMNELSPWENKKYGPAEGELYMSFIVNVIKPYIDANYRTMPGKQHTAIMGSSMGGLISHYAILNYPEVFSKAGIFSPSFWYSEKVYRFAKSNPPEPKARLFYLMGGSEGADSISNMNKMVAQLRQQGHSSERIFSDVVEGGEHSEQFWRGEFERAVLWMFED